MVFNLLGILSQLQLLSPSKLMRLAAAIRQNGVNLMLLFSLVGKVEGGKVALIDSRETFTYKELQEKCENLAFQLKEHFHLKKGQKVAFLCKNHASFVQALFAASRLGADLYLLNNAVSKLQLDRLIKEHDFDLLVYDSEYEAMIEQTVYLNSKIQSYDREKMSISFLVDSKRKGNEKLIPTFSSKIVLLTSGTTGKPEKVVHRPSIFNFLQPFAALLHRLHLISYHTAYIATPIFHGYGIAILLSFFALGKKVVIQNSFDALKACSLIRQHQVEVITVVPLMIHKMMMADKDALHSLACIASGGAKLNPILVKEVNEHLGDVLYNLYGTSEAGLNIIAAPEDLKYDSNTLGKLLAGGRLKIVEDGTAVKDGTVGHFCIRNKWSMTNRKSRWIETGDLGYRDPNGYYFLSGRKDDLIVSAGNNIFPLEIEDALTCHPCVEDAAVIGVKDVYSGQMLQAFVQLNPYQTVSEEALAHWLRKRLAAYQIPRKIVFVKELPYTAVGKLDRKSLQGEREKSHI